MDFSMHGVVWSLVGLFAGSTAALLMVLPSTRTKPRLEPSEPVSVADRLERLEVMAAHHRQQLEAIADEYLTLTGSFVVCCDAEDYRTLAGVVWEGKPSSEALQQIMSRKAVR